MNDIIEFLTMAADELRRLAGSAPEISGDLRTLAEELESEAQRLSQQSRGGSND